jgi:hypothetical protein
MNGFMHGFTKARFLVALGAAMVVSPLTVAAQASTTAPVGTRRDQATERREAIRVRRDARVAMTPEQRAAARTRREARLSAMPADQQEYLRDLRSYQQGLRTQSRDLHAQVASGALTRDAMAQRLKAYRDANRPARPASLPQPRRP